AQLGVEELIHQGLLPKNPSPHQLAWAKSELLNPERNISILAGKMHRLIIALDAKPGNNSNSSTSYREAHLLATLAYLHNGKLDYPTRILKYMQDPALHGLVYGNQEPTASTLI
ncbi:MAG: helicase DnaB, partial [Synechococcaceae bacterium WB5_2A_257]|nr:helicase DnaB [Synechococcaceae bacterium WB5_2A_257]